MSETAAVADSHTVKAPSMGKFERYLTLWVALCIVAGVARSARCCQPHSALLARQRWRK
jgi:ACR3 family arsenite efflux pump ArsB